MRTRRIARSLVIVVGILAGTVAWATPAAAATLPAGFSETIVASGLANPTSMAFAPDGRLFVTQQGGALRIVKNGSLVATPFLTVTVNSSGERGLLGVALDPNFATNQFVYVHYTATSPSIHNRVSRFTANGDVAVPGSEVVILELNNLSATNHNGGAIHFGPDGKLYVAVGDNANSANSQSLSNLLGKMLRINPDGSIPTDNPYYLTATGVNRAIWATGLRNPFTFGFQPGTGRMFINDVGELTYEEINDGIAGSNYGWPNSEGPTSTPGERGPIHSYGHGGSGGCAVAGGAFYNPTFATFPAAYVGTYFFADYCSGWINRIDPANGFAASSFASGISFPVDLRVSADGSLYYLARGTGSTTGVVGRIQYPANQAPTIQAHPANTTVSVGSPASFSVSAAGSQPFSYRWQRNISSVWTDIGGATKASYTLPTTSSGDNGAQFRAIVTNSFGSATSNAATLSVVSNTPPSGTITSPSAWALYRAADTITYSGTGTDAQDGTLGASRFTWQVDFHHDDGNPHTHPFIQPTTGSSGGSFVIPNTGETSANVFYRIILTVTDSGGLTHTTFRDIHPRTATLTLATNPSGMRITLDGQPQNGPYSFVSVRGMLRTIGAPTQTVDGRAWDFDSWSDNGAATHTITTPETNTTYTATFQDAIEPTGSTYVPIAPARVLDTRSAKGLSGTFVANQPRTWQVTGVGGVPAGAIAVTGNVTVTEQSGNGWVTVSPASNDDGSTSTINFPIRDDRANNLTIRLGPGGTLSAVFKAVAGRTTHLIFDVTGYFVATGAGATYRPVTPVRSLDTRVANGLSGLFMTAMPRTWQVGGRDGIPSNAVAVTGNVTVTEQQSGGYLAVTPTAISDPLTSTINFPAGDNRANGLTVALGPGGTLSAVFRGAGGKGTHLIFDVTGYYMADLGGARFVPLIPGRVLDTRVGKGLTGKFVSYMARQLAVVPNGGVPSNATAISGNLTVVNQTWPGYVSLTRLVDGGPPTSTINFPAGDIRANGVTSPLGPSGTVGLVYIGGSGTTDLILDVTGYFR